MLLVSFKACISLALHRETGYAGSWFCVLSSDVRIASGKACFPPDDNQTKKLREEGLMCSDLMCPSLD